jgi:hypothetical protein
MQAHAMRQVSVWLDELAPGQGAFAHALEWAWHLRLPLQPVIAPLQAHLAPTLRRFVRGQILAGSAGFRGTTSEQVEACAAACIQRGVAWDGTPWQEAQTSEEDQRPNPGSTELTVFGDVVPQPLKEELLRRLLRSPRISVLVCPQSWEPLHRVLILNEDPDPASNFLHQAIGICSALRTTPVVLTLARSEEQARQRQQLAVQTFAECEQPADFDFLVGCDTATAVSRVTRWRRCSHVFVQRPDARRWWRCWPDDTMGRLLELPGSLTFLALLGTNDATPLGHESHFGLAASGRSLR